MRRLRGITWDHDRGRAPLEAAGRQFTTQHPDAVITWDARSLGDFEEVTLADLAGEYDLLAVDHPHIGQAHADSALRALDELLSDDALTEQATGSVGASFASYTWQHHLWAAPMDAATQVSAYRQDLLAAVATTPPTSWDEVFALADEFPNGGVALAANPTHLLCCWLSLCHDVTANRRPHLDGRPAWWGEDGLDEDLAVVALNHLYRLLDVADPQSLTLDPIGLLDEMSTGQQVAYAPLVYGYVTYARLGRLAPPIGFTDAPTRDGRPTGTVLGGVGLAVSSSCSDPELAARFVELVVSPEFQRGEYARSGGQPGHREAWTDPAVNSASGGFFNATLATVDAALLRPREPAYPAFQRHAAQVLHQMATKREAANKVVHAVNHIWRTRSHGENT